MIGVFRGVGLCVLAALSLISCQDDLSKIGESVQPHRDIVGGEHVSLQFTASTEVTGSVFSAGLSGLLGQISDPNFGDFRGQFIAQVRTAHNFKFAETPANGQIDSVRLFIKYSDLVGNRAAPLKIAVYEVARGFRGGRTSLTELDTYKDEQMLLGSRVVAPSVDAISYPLTERTNVPAIAIPLSNELGQRIYQKSQDPANFATQESFSQNVLGGLLVTTTTGSGYVLQTMGISLEIFYHKEGAKPTDPPLREVFINTKYTPQLNAFSNTNIDGLTANDGQYSYVKSPAGVHTELRLSTDQLAGLLRGKSAEALQSGAWMLSDVNLRLPVDNPDGLLLNTPSYMLMLPKDSVQSFFEHGYTEANTPNTAILSSIYSIENRRYEFGNISRVITEHLKHQARYTAGSWVVDQPLVLSILPVQRKVQQAGQGRVVTTELDANIAPAIVRLKTDPTVLKAQAISTSFNL